MVGLPDLACKIQMVPDGSKENIENPNVLLPARCHLNNDGPSLETVYVNFGNFKLHGLQL